MAWLSEAYCRVHKARRDNAAVDDHAEGSGEVGAVAEADDAQGHAEGIDEGDGRGALPREVDTGAPEGVAIFRENAEERVRSTRSWVQSDDSVDELMVAQTVHHHLQGRMLKQLAPTCENWEKNSSRHS